MQKRNRKDNYTFHLALGNLRDREKQKINSNKMIDIIKKMDYVYIILSCNSIMHLAYTFLEEDQALFQNSSYHGDLEQLASVL